MKEVFERLERAGITDRTASRLLGLSYYTVRMARADLSKCRVETIDKLTMLAAEAERFSKAAAKIASR